MRHRARSSLLASSLLLVIVAACSAKQTSLSPAGGGAQAARADTKACDRADQDSSSYAHVPLYRECAVDVKARPRVNGARPEFTPARTDGGCYFVAIEVVVDSSGVPEPGTARVLRTNDSMFATAVLSTVPSYGFSPARIGGAAVRQIFLLSMAMTTYVSKSGATPIGPGPAAGRRPPCATRR